MKKLTVFLALLITVLVSGCAKEGKYVAYNTTVSEVSKTLRDFAGISGYRVTYSNETDSLASFRVYMGTTSRIMPGEIETVYVGDTQLSKNQREEDNGDVKQQHDRRAYSKVRTTERPPEEVITNWNFSIQLFQEGDHVRMFAMANGGLSPIKHVKEFFKILKFQGIDVKKA